jgi:hypothetical protein
MKPILTLFILFSIHFSSICIASSVHINDARLKININTIQGPKASTFKFQKTGGFPFAQYAHVRGDVNSLIVILNRYNDHQWPGWRMSKNATANVKWQENQIRKTGKLILSIDNLDQIKAFEYSISNDYVPLNLPDSKL